MFETVCLRMQNKNCLGLDTDQSLPSSWYSTQQDLEDSCVSKDDLTGKHPASVDLLEMKRQDFCLVFL